MQAIARAISRWEPFSERFLASYFKTLRYEFGEPYQRGLLEYYRMAKDLREIGAVPRLEFFDCRPPAPCGRARTCGGDA